MIGSSCAFSLEMIFLPHLPSLEIRENGIDTLIAIWRDNIPFMGGYLTKDGHVDLERAQIILEGLAKQEDAIFRRRKETEDRREAGAKRRKLQAERGGRGGPRWRSWWTRRWLKIFHQMVDRLVGTMKPRLAFHYLLQAPVISPETFVP